MSKHNQKTNKGVKKRTRTKTQLIKYPKEQTPTTQGKKKKGLKERNPLESSQ